MVSVIVPSYNHEKFIDSFIESVIFQSFDDIELIICDDCSQDSTWERIKNRENELKKRFKNVIIFRHDKNKGVTVTLNDMLKKCSGDWIKPIASDDMLEMDYINRVDNLFKENTNIDVIITNGFYINEDQRFPLNHINDDKYYIEAPDFSTDGLFARLYEENTVFAPGAAIRKKVYEKCGYYDESIAVEDWEFWLRVTRNDLGFLYCDEPLCSYRVNSNSMMSLKKNEGNERRFLRFHKAETAVIDKYGVFVTKSKYAKRKFRSIELLYWFGERNGYKEAKDKAIKEFKEFGMWRALGPRKAMGFVWRILKNKIRR